MLRIKLLAGAAPATDLTVQNINHNKDCLTAPANEIFFCEAQSKMSLGGQAKKRKEEMPFRIVYISISDIGANSIGRITY